MNSPACTSVVRSYPNVNGLSLVAFSRRLSHPDGSFAGVVLTAMLQDQFQAMFKDASLGPNGR